MSKVLVLGDGLLGSEIVKQTGWNYISRRKDGISIDKISMFCQGEEDVIVNCIGYTNTYSDNRELHMDVNFKFVVNLVNACNMIKKKLVHISTDYVYSNSIQYAKETDVPVHNHTWYGYSKVLADGYIENFSNDYLICRMTHKPKPFPYDKAWVNQIGNFDYVDNQVKRLVSLITSDAFGTINVGRETVSMYELAKETKEDVRRDECDYPVPEILTMNIDKMKEMI